MLHYECQKLISFIVYYGNTTKRAKCINTDTSHLCTDLACENHIATVECMLQWRDSNCSSMGLLSQQNNIAHYFET